MKGLGFQVNGWMEGDLPRENALTNTLLTISVDGVPLTHIYRKSMQSLTDSVCLPLYPLAEWLSANWWRLLYDCNNCRAPENFAVSHNLMYAGEGYFLPNCSIVSEMDTVRFAWQPRSINQGDLNYIATGASNIQLPQFQSEISRIIAMTIERLNAFQLHDTPLHRNFEAIRNSMQNREEREFCIACAQLGFDPYCLDDDTAIKVMNTADGLAQITAPGEFLNAVNLEEAEQATRWIAENQKGIAPAAIPNLSDIHERMPASKAVTPWEQGYEEARWIRANWVKTQEDVMDFRKRVEDSTQLSDIPSAFCTAAVNSNALFFASMPPSGFLTGRLLSHYLHTETSSVNLVTHLTTPPQKRSRAFSAELQAPSEQIRLALHGRKQIARDEVLELAEAFKTNESTILYQLENHRLATIVA